ncbi:MAG TPA: hypothetical protein VEJ18_05900 [Planctomycetota bacterium]|nr:hypothetical protein [Planctomycetota bacterium]
MPSSVQAVDRARGGAGVRVDVPVRSSRYTILLQALFSGAGVIVSSILALSVAGLLGAPEDVPLPPVAARAALLGAVVVATLFLAWRLAWNLGGREIYAREGSRLTIRREIAGVGRTRAFEWSRVHDLRVGSFRDQPVAYASWGRPFVGKGDAYVVFDYDGTPHFYGRGMDTEEARTLVSTLQRVGTVTVRR